MPRPSYGYCKEKDPLCFHRHLPRRGGAGYGKGRKDLYFHLKKSTFGCFFVWVFAPSPIGAPLRATPKGCPPFGIPIKKFSKYAARDAAKNFQKSTTRCKFPLNESLPRFRRFVSRTKRVGRRDHAINLRKVFASLCVPFSFKKRKGHSEDEILKNKKQSRGETPPVGGYTSSVACATSSPEAKVFGFV